MNFALFNFSHISALDVQATNIQLRKLINFTHLEEGIFLSAVVSPFWCCQNELVKTVVDHHLKIMEQWFVLLDWFWTEKDSRNLRNADTCYQWTNFCWCVQAI